jgi:hypothetical protein
LAGNLTFPVLDSGCRRLALLFALAMVPQAAASSSAAFAVQENVRMVILVVSSLDWDSHSGSRWALSIHLMAIYD